jgi:type VI secretion system protein ImpK
MHEEIANVAYQIFTYGIRLKQELGAEDKPDFALAQRELKGLLQSADKVQQTADFGGDRLAQESSRSRYSGHFLGIRYALVCWLDEIFIIDSPWNDQWNEASLEANLYGDRERAWRFWEQAERAGARPSHDALEIFFLCVMLGFQGEKRDSPEDLKSWCDRTRSQLSLGQETFPLPPEGLLRFNAPPLTGAGRYQNMLLGTAVAILLLVPILTFLLVLSLK